METGIETRLKELGIILPDRRPSSGNYEPAVFHNGELITSGHGSWLGTAENVVAITGKAHDFNLKEGYGAARIALVNCLASVQFALGSLNNVDRIIMLRCYVNTSPHFEHLSKVADGASDLLKDIFEERGAHARTTVGVESLPHDLMVELDLRLTVHISTEIDK